MIIRTLPIDEESSQLIIDDHLIPIDVVRIIGRGREIDTDLIRKEVESFTAFLFQGAVTP